MRVLIVEDEPALVRQLSRALDEAGYATDAAMDGEHADQLANTESYDAIQARVLPVWQRLTAELAGQSLVIVTHGVVCKVLLTSIGAGWGPADWPKVGSIRNAAVHELLGGNGRWRIVRLNDPLVNGGDGP